MKKKRQKKKKSIRAQKYTLLLCGWSNTRIGFTGTFRSLHLADTQSPATHGPGQSALADPSLDGLKMSLPT